jgi:hypothetical protein
LDQIGLTTSIHYAVQNINFGRKGFATRGKEQEGRISYEDGISEAMTIFQEIQKTGNAQELILTEHAFLTQEYQLCEQTDTDTINSLSKAIQNFDDAYLAVKTLDETDYKTVDKFFPHNSKYRVNDYPKDSFHIACISHKTRIKNILRTPGLDPIEKAMLKQRLKNLPVAQKSYLEKQKKALTKVKD